MAWKPIATAGVPFLFTQDFGDPQLAGSVVTAEFQSGPAWTIAFTDNVARNVRITVQAYSSQQFVAEEPSYFVFIRGGDDPLLVVNENAGNTSEFAPNPVIELADSSVQYRPGSGGETVRDESYQMLVEVEADAAPIIRPILQTFRGYRGADSAFRSWIRTDEGRADLSAATVTVRVYAYDSRAMLVELAATADALGLVEFTLPQASASRQLPGNLFRLELVMSVDGGVQLVQLGILELLG